MNSSGFQRRLTGAFINTHPAQCSIFESGVMVAGCLAGSSVFDLHCTDLAEIDLDELRCNRRLVSKPSGAARVFPAHFDFWVFNWHFITMAGYLDPATIAALEGLKFTVVLELAEHDPLIHVPKNTFDGYLALDPLVPENDGVFPFPRPLHGTALEGRPRRRVIPVIGSFGFGTQGKGFELLVEAVNREFDRALVRINVPIGDYVLADPNQARNYATHMAAKCRQIAKPGVEVQFTHEFLSPEALIDWCHDNELNCFMYTRDQPGLSATTDQAILSGQPLLTLTNATFRHIHPYIAPYPLTSLLEAMDTTATAVAAMQRDWSKSQFCARFESMLASFDLEATAGAGHTQVTWSKPVARKRNRVLVLHRTDGTLGDLRSYATRFTNAISRPATRDISKAVCDTVAMAIVAVLDKRPDVVIALDQGAEWVSQLAACFGAQRTFRLLDASSERRGLGMDASPPPIIPFFTGGIPSPTTSIAWLIGFEAEDAVPLCRWFARIANETRIVRIVVEAAQEDSSAMALCVHSYGPVKRGDAVVSVEVRTLPDRGDEMIRELAAESVLIFHAGIDKTNRTEAICSLALCTERAVVFDPAAPLPAFGSALCLSDDQSLQDRIERGISGQIAVLRDYGEWVTAARWLPRIDGVDDDVVNVPSPDLSAAIALSGFDRLDEEDFVRGLYLTMLGRDADNSELESQLDALWMGRTRTEVALSIVQTGGTQFPFQTSGARTHTLTSDVTTVGVLQPYLQGWLGDLFSLNSSEFVRAAYQAGLCRDAGPDELTAHRALIESGETRLYALNAIIASPEAALLARQRVVGELPQPRSVAEERAAIGSAWIRQLSLLDAATFLDVACRFCLGRSPKLDEFGPESTNSVRSRLRFLDSLRSSARGATWLATISASIAAKGLSALTENAAMLTEQLSQREPAGPLDTRLSQSVEVRKESSSPLAFLGVERVHPVLWILTGTEEDSAFHRRLLAAKDFMSRPMVAVGWNRTVRRLKVAAGSSTGEVFLSSEICRAGDWLVVLGGFGSQVDDLPEMDVLMTARTLGLRSACIFGGAEVLERETSDDIAAVRACERHMQALLLADVILPISNRARDEIVDVLAESQRASEGPAIVKLPLPIGRASADDAAWDTYARKLRALLTRIDYGRNGIGSVLYLDRRSDVRDVVQSELPMLLRDRGVAVVELVWQEERIGFANSSIRPELSDLPEPRWLLVNGALPASAVPAVRAFAFEWRASVAALSPAASPQLDFRPYFAFDRLIAGTDEEYSALTAQVLETRERLPEAEYRFVFVEQPGVRRSKARPGIAAGSRHSGGRFAVIAASGSDGRLIVAMNVLSQVALSGLRQIEAVVHVVSDDADRERRNFSAAGVDCSAAPTIDAALRESDAALVLGDAAFVRRIVDTASWVGVPVVVPHLAASPVMPGVVAVDFDRSGDVEHVLLRLLDDLWRTTLRTEALLRRPRTDEDYVDEILRSLAPASDFRGLTAVRPSGQISIYSRLPALERRPLLSVCISTYNRAGWLAVGLKNLFEQLGPSSLAEVEVVVVDNAAADNTPQVVQPYLARSDFRYYRNRTNVGMLGNLAVTAQRAKGSYVWIIGDDDLTQPGAVTAILSALRTYPQLAMVYLNYGYTSVADPTSVGDIADHLSKFNVLEPEGPDLLSTVAGIAANSENFYTAIYACVFQRSHALRAFCQDTSGRPFSTMLTCIPTAYYALHCMAELPAYWIGKPVLVVNSNVSWAQYGPLFDLEQLPRTWDLAERAGTAAAAVDARRSNRLWLVEMMWRDIFENDVANNSPYFSAARVLIRLKHLPKIDERIPEMRAIYRRAYTNGHPAAILPPEALFSAWPAS